MVPLSNSSLVALWAEAVCAVARAPVDITTLDRWAGLMNMSRSTLKNRCRAVRAGAKDSLVLGRLARTLALGSPSCWQPECWLDVADERTLTALLRKGGLLEHRHAPRPLLTTLLADHQLLIPRTTGWILAGRLLTPLPR